jgi:cytoskeletal protein CcmA (bactofilin family)
MDTNPPSPVETSSEEDSLEGSSTVVEPNAAAPEPGAAPPQPGAPAPESGIDDTPSAPPRPASKWWRYLAGRFNIYLLMFILVVVVGVTIVVVAYLDSKHGSGTSSISSQSLSQSTFSKLANSDSTVGNSGQVLTIQSSAIFAGKVLVRQDLEVAGNLQIGGTLALNDLSVAGTAQFSQVQINKNLSVAGNTSLQGAVTVAKSLQVSGSGSFSGPLSAPQLTTSSLQLNGDLTLTHHITTGGATPGRTNGGALGGGGTSSVSGSDTGGSITINTGGSPAAGCFLTVNFTSKYNATPHVLVTPIGSAAGGLAYYVDRSSTGFSVCDATPPPAGTSFGFDYFVVD